MSIPPPPTPAQRYVVFHHGTTLIIFCAALALVVAAALPLDLRSEDHAYTFISYVCFMIRTFRFHIGLGLLPVVAVAWWLRSRRPALVGGLLLAWTLLPALWSLLPADPAPLSGPTLSVMSMNLLFVNRDSQAILKEISEHDPDIILFQEYTPRAHAQLAPALAARYPHHVNAGREDAYGQATYSKLPFVESPAIYPQASVPLDRESRTSVANSDPHIRVVVPLAGRNVVVQNVHLASPVGLNNFADQRRMADWLGAWSASEQRPVIIGGDFNATPDSAEIQSLIGTGLHSAHAAAGRGRASTWPDRTFLRFFPGVKIDHLLYRGLACDRSAVGGSTGSDHLPIIARFGFAD